MIPIPFMYPEMEHERERLINIALDILEDATFDGNYIYPIGDRVAAAEILLAVAGDDDIPRFLSGVLNRRNDRRRNDRALTNPTEGE